MVINMKTFTKKLLASVLAILMIMAIIPFTVSAANYETPAFLISLESETSTEVVVSLNLLSGSFHGADFEFVAVSGYTCKSIAKGTAFKNFDLSCIEGSKDVPIQSTNPNTRLVSFASTELYSEKGSFYTAKFTKTAGKTYNAGDISVVFSNCAILEGSETIVLKPSVSGTLTFDVTSVETNYNKSFKITASSQGCTWSSSNTKVATVDQDGNVKAVGKGSAVITATLGSTTATCDVTVKFNFGQWLLFIFCFGWIWM